MGFSCLNPLSHSGFVGLESYTRSSNNYREHIVSISYILSSDMTLYSPFRTSQGMLAELRLPSTSVPFEPVAVGGPWGRGGILSLHQHMDAMG